MHKQGTGETEKQLIGLFPEADIIFIEGLKDSTFKKIEVIKKGVSDEPVSNPEGRFLIVSDLTEKSFSEDTVHPDDIGSVISIIDSI